MLIVESAPLNTARIVGFDTIARIDLSIAQRLVSVGFVFAVSYVGLREGDGAPLDAEHLDALMTAGLRVMPVQFARTSGWSAESGRADGAAAARNAIAAGIPSATTLWCDLEGGIPSAHIAVAYANGWHDAARAAGIEEPGIYVGAGVPLSERELYQELAFSRYWRSLSQVPNVDVRGYQMLQLFPDDQVVEGVQIDVDVIQSDYLGGRPRWARRQ